MQKTLIIFALSFFADFAISSEKQTPQLDICTLPLPGNMVINKDQGFLIDLLKITLGSGHKLNIDVYPIQRAIKVFKEKKCDLLATTMLGFFKAPPERSPYLELPTGMQDHFTIFSHDQALIEKSYDKKGLKTKEPLRIIKVRSWPVPDFLLGKNKIYQANDMKMAIKMLKAKRADFFIGFNYLVRSYLRKEKFDSIEVAENLKFEEKEIVFVVNPERASGVEDLYRKNFKKLLDSGERKALLDKYAVPKWLLSEKYQ